MADSDTKKKIMDHRRGVMLDEAGKDGFLKEILANGQRPVVESIVNELVREEPERLGGLMKSDTIVREIKTRWTARQEEVAPVDAVGRA